MMDVLYNFMEVEMKLLFRKLLFRDRNLKKKTNMNMTDIFYIKLKKLVMRRFYIIDVWAFGNNISDDYLC